jgi:hypothetical protein
MKKMRFCLVGWARTDGGAGQGKAAAMVRLLSQRQTTHLVHRPWRLEVETPLLLDAEPWIVIVLKATFLVGLLGRRYVVALDVDSRSQAETAHQSPKARKKVIIYKSFIHEPWYHLSIKAWFTRSDYPKTPENAGCAKTFGRLVLGDSTL